MSNYISAEFPQDKETDAITHITAAIEDMPFLIKLDKGTKRSMMSLDDSHVPFVEKCLQYGQKNAGIVPSYVNIGELGKDFTLFTQMQSISRDVNRFAEMVNDTRIAAGTDAYLASLSIYNSVKQAAKMGVPGSQTIVDDLKKAFENHGPASGQTLHTTPTPTK
jgi:hypothetical protein